MQTKIQPISMQKIALGLMCCAFGLQGLEYEPQLENDYVSVARVKIFPHEEIGLHRDASPQVVIALQGGTITRLESNGQEVDVAFPTGAAVFRNPDPEGELHRSVNNSSEPVEIIVIQLKQ